MKQHRIADRQFGAHVGGHALGKLGASIGVQRHRQHAAQQAAIKGGDPLGAVFSPQQNPVAQADLALSQKCGKAPRQQRQLSVGGRAPPVALKVNDRDLAVVAAEIVEQCSQVVEHISPAKLW